MFNYVPDKPLGCMPTALCIYVTKKSLKKSLFENFKQFSEKLVYKLQTM